MAKTFARKPDDIGKVFQIMRERERRAGTVVIPRRICCPSCNKFREVGEMGRIADTGIVRNVLDCLCLACHREHGAEFTRLARLVCAGCREVVDVLEPGKERVGGYNWLPGSFAHVAMCPSCSTRAGLRMSPIVEKLDFYQTRGIPHER